MKFFKGKKDEKKMSVEEYHTHLGWSSMRQVLDDDVGHVGRNAVLKFCHRLHVDEAPLFYLAHKRIHNSPAPFDQMEAAHDLYDRFIA